MSVIHIIKTARELIDTEEKWTRDVYARNSRREMVDEMSSDAVCFCTLGALSKAWQTSPNKQSGEYVTARKELSDTLYSRDNPKAFSVPTFNDHPSTTHADVLVMFDDTIKRLTLSQG